MLALPSSRKFKRISHATARCNFRLMRVGRCTQQDANRILTVRGEKKTKLDEQDKKNRYVMELSSYVAAFRLAAP